MEPKVTVPDILRDPDTINVLGLSGGKDSLAQALVAKEEEIPNQILTFADTGNEHDLTYEYMDYLESKLGKIERVKANFDERIRKKAEYVKNHWPKKLRAGVPGKWAKLKKNTPDETKPTEIPKDQTQFGIQKNGWVWLTSRAPLTDEQIEIILDRALAALKPTGNPFLDLCIWKGRFPSTRKRFCTFELKHYPIRDKVFLPLLEKHDDVVSWQGVRAQESENRVGLAEFEEDIDETAGLHVFRGIHKWKHEDVFSIAKRHGIKPNPLYTMGCGRVGCMPCVNVNKNELKEICSRFPEVLERISNWEYAVAAASKWGNSTFFCSTIDPANAERDNRLITVESHGIYAVKDWATTTRGGRQFDLFFNDEPNTTCSSIYASVCE